MSETPPVPRWCILDVTDEQDWDRAAILAWADAQDTLVSFSSYRDGIWPGCAILDTHTWEICS